MSAVQRGVQVAAVVTLSIFWALNWPMMKIGLSAVEPWTFRAVIVSLGGIGCLLVARALGHSIKIPRRELVPVLWVGFFQGILWNGFSGVALALVEAGRAAVLAFTMPVWATLFAAIFLKEGISLRRLIGLMVGMVAMALLILPAFEALNRTFTGTMLMLAGAMAWAAATVIVRGVNWTLSPLVLGGWQSVVGAGPLLVAAFVVGDPATLGNLDTRTTLAMAYSILLPMIICQAIFYTIVRQMPASLASTSTLMVPPLGVFFSAAIIGEQVGGFEIAALILVMVAMVFTLPGFSWRRLRRRPPPPAA